MGGTSGLQVLQGAQLVGEELGGLGLSQGREPEPPALYFWIWALNTGDGCTQRQNSHEPPSWDALTLQSWDIPAP